MIKDADLYAMLLGIKELNGIPIRPDTASELDGSSYITYQVVSLQDGAYTLDGESSLVPWRYQIDVYSPIKATAVALSKPIVSGLYQSVKAILMNMHSNFENETKSHRVSMDFSIWFSNET